MKGAAVARNADETMDMFLDLVRPSRSWTVVSDPRLKKLQRFEPVERPSERHRETSGVAPEMHREAYRNARRMTRAALRPGAPMMPPPGWAEEPQR